MASKASRSATSTSTPGAASTMRSLDRAFDIIEVLDRSQTPLRLTEVARRAGLHPATAQRILGVLQRRGFVAHKDQTYRLGVAALAAAHAFLVTDSMSGSATPVLQELAAATGMTASLHLRLGLERVLIARVDGRHPLRYQLPIGQRLPLHLGAGKVVAAALRPEEVDTLIKQVGDLDHISGRSVSQAEFTAELAAIRQQGYHISISERAAGTAGISAPVTVDGEVVAALSLSGLAENHPPELLHRLAPEVLRAAQAIARTQS